MKETNMGSGKNKKVKSLPEKVDKRDGKVLEKNSRRNLKVKDSGATGPSSDKLNSRTALSNPNIGAETPEACEHMAVTSVSDALVHDEDEIGTIDMDDRSDNRKLDTNSSDMEIVDESGASEELDTNQSNGHSQKSKPDLKQEDKLDTVTPTRIGKTLYDNMKTHPTHEQDPLKMSNGQYADSDHLVEVLDDACNGNHVLSSDENGINIEIFDKNEDRAMDKKIEELETRIKNLEGELTEVAALELALYSVVPEHGGSVYKVHTPARRLSRLYMHACKYWSQDKRASVARNIVSGLVLISKSCSSDVSRLSFWLSNAIVLREILSQTWNSCASKTLKSLPSGVEAMSSPLKMSNGNTIRKQNEQRFLQLDDDRQEARTFTAALERVESWIFCRMVELIWWQTLTPNMQSPGGDSPADIDIERLPPPADGGQKQGDFSINLWKNAFHDAYKRLCPLRAGGHECGCLPVLARKVVEQCIGRLDIAMFNAVLRESAHEMPTDPVSDPILDPNVLPIPAGDLSFGSGAQLKNTVGNWSRWLSNFLGMDFDTTSKEENEIQDANDGQKTFPLLNELSDLLMLPKDMLLDRAVRMEVCPLISMPLIKRVLCNFSPDEFCPDPVPGAVLEALNAECIDTLSEDSSRNFPYTASPVVYTLPSSLDVSEKVAEANTTPRLSRNASFNRKGYTSDEELDELESCLTSVVGTAGMNGNGDDAVEMNRSNVRYDLLREVWKSADGLPV